MGREESLEILDAAGAIRAEISTQGNGVCGAPFSVSRRFSLLPDDLDEPAAVPGAVEPDEEDALPRAQAELAVLHGDRLAGRGRAASPCSASALPNLCPRDRCSPSVGPSRRARSTSLGTRRRSMRMKSSRKPVSNSFTRTMQVVGRIHTRDPVGDAALGDGVPHVFGDVADLEAAARAQAPLGLEDLHASAPSAAVRRRLVHPGHAGLFYHPRPGAGSRPRGSERS